MKNIILLIFFLVNFQLSYSDIVIICHPKSPIKTISKDELKKIFTGRIKSINGHRISPILFENNQVEDLFLKNFINMSSSQYKRHWAKMVFTGKAKKPKAYNNEKELISAIESNIYHITFLNKESFSKYDERVSQIVIH
jgi:ABC-type phosphate transport system substrate-binding protein